MSSSRMENVYSVLYGAYKPYKKHKQWTDDGILRVTGKTVTLENANTAKPLGTITIKSDDEIEDGNCLVIGNYECEIQELIKSVQRGQESEAVEQKPTEIIQEKEEVISLSQQRQSIYRSPVVTPFSPVVPMAPLPFKNPLIQKGEQRVVPRKAGEIATKSLYESGFLFPRPPSFAKKNDDVPIVDVRLDPRLTDLCRPHQLEGISFLYQCIMGFRESAGSGGPIGGAILADEMGLGKTLQCIALIYTLLKQSPFGGRPVIKHAIIVTPSSLINNWRDEFKKWIGNERGVTVFAVTAQNKADYLKALKSSLTFNVLIISYETFTQCADVLDKLRFDLLICDEGHRLKNSKSKTFKTILDVIKTDRKIIVTGTPFQNNFEELYSLANFVNPDVLGKYSKFKRIYEDPIKASQETGSSGDTREKGEQANEELSEILKVFTLRRTKAETISKFLPPKTEYVICCKPTPLQITMYKRILSSGQVRSILLSIKSSSDQGSVFAFLSALRKICNHPALLPVADEDDCDTSTTAKLVDTKDFPNDYEAVHHSGKLSAVSEMLDELKKTKEKIVLVSNFTKTLDIFEKLCESKGLQFCRLDGSTNSSKRQDIVDSFNRPTSLDRVFLLSTKAGGVGLNLVGASRLVLYDLDWNPAHDQQAMARIHRDGQKRHVYIYRLITTGSIEEKIFQRQMMKQGLSDAVVDKGSNVKFSTDELKDLFTFAGESSKSTTYDMLRGLNTVQPPIKKQKISDDACKFDLFNDVDNDKENGKAKGMAELQQWEHFHGEGLFKLSDELFATGLDNISFVFRNKPDAAIQVKIEK